ncbi:MAG: HYExAFE family protein [Phycisphaerales bacterium]|nr:HYExAFE family protein [Phycisphaerales bacterium]
MGPRTKPVMHYEAAFEDYLRRKGLPYIAVDEAKKALFAGAKLKSFDFVVYRPNGKNLLVDVKGRKLAPPSPSLQNWTTREDIDDLRQWQDIFGNDFCAMFLFMFHWPGAPETAPLKDLILHQERWYGMLAISVTDYREYMRPRSEAWGTVHLPIKEFKRLAKPFDEWL